MDFTKKLRLKQQIKEVRVQTKEERYDTQEAKYLLDISEIMGLGFAKRLREKKYSIRVLHQILLEAKSIQEAERDHFKDIEDKYKKNIAIVEREFEEDKKFLEKEIFKNTILFQKLYLENDYEYKAYCETAAKAHEGLE